MTSAMRLSFASLSVATLAVCACAAQTPKTPSDAQPPHPPPQVVETQPAEEPPAKVRRTSPAQHVSQGEYLSPPAEVIRLLERASPPKVKFHAQSRQMARSYFQKLFAREQMARPFLALAGMRIEPERLTHSREPLGTHIRINSIDKSREARELRPPEGAYFGEAQFSPEGTRLAVPLIFEDELKIAVYDVARAELEEIATPPLSAVWGPPCLWTNERELLCFAERDETPPLSDEPVPRIYELKSGSVPARTYSGLLQGASDDALFERYGRVRLIAVELSTKEVTDLPPHGLITSASLSPNAEYILVTQLAPPYSRLVPAWKFPVQQLVYRRSTGEVVHSLTAPLSRSTTGVAFGPRVQAWNPRAPAELVYVERLETASGGTQERLVRHRAPFDMAPEVISDALRRVTFLGWTSAGVLTVTDAPAGKPWTSYRLSAQGLDFLAEGGPSEAIGDLSRAVLTDGSSGAILEHKGAFFFAREVPIDGKKVQELVLWDSNKNTTKRALLGRAGEHMEVLGVLSPDRFEYLLSVETNQSPPKVVVTRAGRRRVVTPPPARHPELEGVKRRDLRIRRDDGVTMPATLFLPPGFQPNRPVPTVMWIYPRQFPDPEAAERFTEGTDHYFDVGGPSRLSVLTQGYALLDLPAVPIVGEVKTGRDDFLPQLIQGAEAAVDTLVEIGVSERGRVYPMGRSYGAFAVANLLAHSRSFRTGIAMNGAYNRTLTPFGFQHETRTFWESTDAYINVSPFFFADEIEGSLLLIHGEEDENAGTPILQSERFYAALVGNGVRSRYVALPFEGHQLRGRDGVLHATAEILNWLDAAEREFLEERDASRVLPAR